MFHEIAAYVLDWKGELTPVLINPTQREIEWLRLKSRGWIGGVIKGVITPPDQPFMYEVYMFPAATLPEVAHEFFRLPEQAYWRDGVHHLYWHIQFNHPTLHTFTLEFIPSDPPMRPILRVFGGSAQVAYFEDHPYIDQLLLWTNAMPLYGPHP